jgi:hypothetical protein
VLLGEFPFSSLRAIADSLNFPASTVYSHLVEKTGPKDFLLRWVPHMLTGELRQKRVELAGQFLRVLEGQQKVGFYDIVIGDDSWFMRHSDHRQICVYGRMRL